MVEVVSTWGNRKAISGGMGTDDRKIKEEVDRSPGGGDQSIAMAKGGGGKGINPHSPPSEDDNTFELPSRRRGSGKGSITCQSPHVPESLATQ